RTKLKKYYKLTTKYINKINKNKRNVQRTATGFSRPKPIPSTLKILLNFKEDDLATRPDLTKKIYKYIEINNLRSSEDKRILRVNDNLKNALNCSKPDLYVYGIGIEGII
ncbi:MAG: SWIB/MDM2 domain-containing protein, partial [Paludibacter sp.]